MGKDIASNGGGLAALEEAVRAVEPGALLVEPRLLRRIVKQHHRVGGLGLQVPHDRCLALAREELLAVVGPERLGPAARGLPRSVVLLQRPALDGSDEARARALTTLWRELFHTRIHVELERRLVDGSLTDAALRGRVHRIGQTEFDEIRLVLRQDNHLLPPYGDRGTYVEFAALYLELRRFDERALAKFFPTLDDLDAVDAVLAQDVDATAVLAATRPAGAELPPAEAPVEHLPVHGSWWEQPPGPPAAGPGGDDATRAAQVGNLVRAAILTLAQERRAAPAARDVARLQITALADRLAETLDLPDADAPETRAQWVERAANALTDLADAAAGRGGPRRTVEARLLHDLQKACTENEIRTVDVVGWALSLGRRSVVRSLPALREVRIARHLRAAEQKLARVHLPEGQRREVADVIHAVRFRADVNVRASLAPRLRQVLDQAGYVARNVPERVARRKIVSELLDQVVERGTFGLGHLRDAVSRSALKLPDLSLGELFRGDQLLKMDRALASALDGVYRSGDLYMRLLQKVSSLLFGTWLGRQLTLYFILPLGAAFVILEGLNHLVGPVLGRLHGHKVHLLTRWSFAAAALALFFLIHAPACRRGALHALRALRWVLATVFWRAPRWLLTRPLVRRLVASRPFRLLLDWVVEPAALVAPFLLLWRVLHLDRRVALAAEGALFVAVAVVANSRYGRLLEETIVDGAQRAVHQVRARILPGLFQLIVQVFRSLLDGLERVLYAVDEWLRFRRGEGVLGRVGKGAFGVVWFFVTYLIRIYVNLLIEPQVNPIKHFPVVTVSHKIILPMTPTFISILRVPFMPLGPVIANTIAATTTVLLPGVFGFLVWEFKENWKLYRGAADKPLAVARVGHHGETMGSLLKPGFHSGTVPKLYTKLRRATWRGADSVGKHQEAVHHTAEAVKKFVEREWVGLLMETPRWGHARPVSVGQVELGSNRIRVELRAPSVGARSAWLVLEEQSGWILASLERDGGRSWVHELDAEGRRVLEAALCGLYTMAGVQLVREQIEAELGRDTPYDIADEGLVVWPGAAYETELIYDLGQPGRLKPRVRGAAPDEPPAELPATRIRFGDHPVRWSAWVDAWADAPGRDGAACADGTLLPPRDV